MNSISWWVHITAKCFDCKKEQMNWLTPKKSGSWTWAGRTSWINYYQRFEPIDKGKWLHQRGLILPLPFNWYCPVSHRRNHFLLKVLCSVSMQTMTYYSCRSMGGVNSRQNTGLASLIHWSTMGFDPLAPHVSWWGLDLGLGLWRVWLSDLFPWTVQDWANEPTLLNDTSVLMKMG